MARDLERQVAMGARLKALRESRPDLTQQKIAEAIGITVRGYQFYEAGDTGIDHDRVEALADLFGVSTRYLYEGEVDEPTAVDPGQLDRIEAKLDRLLAAMPLPDPLGLAQTLEPHPQPAPRRTAPQEQPATPARRRRAG